MTHQEEYQQWHLTRWVLLVVSSAQRERATDLIIAPAIEGGEPRGGNDFRDLLIGPVGQRPARDRRTSSETLYSVSVSSSSAMANSHHYGKLDMEQKILAEGIGTAFPSYGTEGQPRACPTTFGRSPHIAIEGPCANDPKGRRQRPGARGF